MATARPPLESVDALTAALDEQDYLVDPLLASSLFLALHMERPLLLEGEAGTGKTEAAKAVSSVLGTELIRLQCYEGIDSSQSLYEWDHARQLLHLRSAESSGGGDDPIRVERDLYSDRFLLRRPLLRAISAPAGSAPPVLLIDEIDRADDEFEALLLELLSDFAITIPELGTVRAEVRPIVIVTSNRTRDVHDALKRRCLYHWVDHPTLELELQILRRRVPMASDALVRQVALATSELRALGLYKPPGVAEAIDWATAMTTLSRGTLDHAAIEATMGSVVKYREDQARVHDIGIDRVVAAAAGTAS